MHIYKHKLFRNFFVALAGGLLSTLAQAHHGMTTKFDPARSETLKGTVARIDWSFPHVHIYLTVTKDGETLPWYVELESPQLLELSGWAEDTVKIGQALTVEGFRARDDSRQVWGESLVDATGKAVLPLKYESLVESITSVSTDAAPRWPDDQIRLGAPPGRSGYWVPENTVLKEDGVNVAMLANGQLENIADASKVAPMQPWALALYQTRQKNFLRNDPTYLECRPPAGPRKFMNAYGIQLLEDRPLNRIFVIAGGGNHDWHLIYTDGRALDSEDFYLDAGNLLYYGRNTGHWEGDTFVIESAAYNEKFWLPGGLPHTDLMHVTEKLTRVNFGTLKYELTINDPGTYTRPWTATWNLRWLDGQDPQEHYCQDNRL